MCPVAENAKLLHEGFGGHNRACPSQEYCASRHSQILPRASSSIGLNLRCRSMIPSSVSVSESGSDPSEAKPTLELSTC